MNKRELEELRQMAIRCKRLAPSLYWMNFAIGVLKLLDEQASKRIVGAARVAKHRERKKGLKNVRLS